MYAASERVLVPSFVRPVQAALDAAPLAGLGGTLGGRPRLVAHTQTEHAPGTVLLPVGAAAAVQTSRGVVVAIARETHVLPALGKL